MIKMDKYITKTPRSQGLKTKSKQTSNLKQSTIESLLGVVIIEDIKRLKATLKVSGQSPEVLLDSLKTLAEKVPPKHVLKSTKIGHVVYRLQKHPDASVAKTAKNLYKKWVLHFEQYQNRPCIEVKCDAKSEKLRDSGRKFLAEALLLTVMDPLVDAIEREIFHLCKKLINGSYRRTLRTIVLKLKHSDDLRSKVFNRVLSVEDLVKQFKK